MHGRRAILTGLAAAFWVGSPLALVWPDAAPLAAWANQGGSGSGSGSGGSGGGSGSSGGGSGSGHNDDDDDDGNDDDHGNGNSGKGGSGSGGSGSGGSGSGNSGGYGAGPGGEGGKDWLPRLAGDGIHVQYADGHIERIREGRFERIDKSGRFVERRDATAQEERRLRTLEAEFGRKGRASGILTIADVDERAGRVEITDFRGWRETLSEARYQLRDPNGRTVSRRALTSEDVARLRSLLLLN